MKIHKITLVGKMSSNCYIIYDNNEAVVVDPGFDDNNLYNYLKSKNLNVVNIVLTHGHFDHWGGLKRLREMYPDAKLFASSVDEFWFNVGPNNHYGYEPKIDNDLRKLNKIKLLSYDFKIIAVPGHSAGSIALYHRGILISGDVLFYNSIGRYDLPEGDYDTLINSVKKLYTLPDETIVYSGHGPETTIGREKKYNPFIRI